MEVLPQRSAVTHESMWNLEPWMWHKSGSSVKLGVDLAWVSGLSGQRLPQDSNWDAELPLLTPTATSENDDGVSTNHSLHRYTQITNAKFS